MLRRTPLRRMPFKGRRKDTGPDAKTVLLVRERDGWCCVICGSPGPLNTDHRKNRSQGVDNSPSNLITVCGSGTTGCHGWKGSRIEEARDLGYVVLSHEDPAEVPVHVRTVYGDRIVYLNPAGQYVDPPLLEETS